MSTQPKPIGVRALRLADEFERPYWDDGTPHGQLVKAATELRRLHAEIQRCRNICDATAEGWRTDAEEWKAERAALAEPSAQQEVPKRTVTYVCPVCAASLERKE